MIKFKSLFIIFTHIREWWNSLAPPYFKSWFLFPLLSWGNLLILAGITMKKLLPAIMSGFLFLNIFPGSSIVHEMFHPLSFFQHIFICLLSFFCLNDFSFFNFSGIFNFYATFKTFCCMTCIASQQSSKSDCVAQFW